MSISLIIQKPSHPKNRVFIEANDSGYISWGDFDLHPYIFAANFLEHGHGWAEGEIKGFTIDKLLSQDVEDKYYNKEKSPVRQIELRKLGLLTELGWHFTIQLYRNNFTGKVGYIFDMKDSQLEHIRDANINHQVISH